MSPKPSTRPPLRWHKFYWDDHLDDRELRQLSLPEQGALYRLESAAWRHGGTLPLDPVQAAAEAGFQIGRKGDSLTMSQLESLLDKYFPEKAPQYELRESLTIAEEYGLMSEKFERASATNRKSALKRWNGEG